MLNKMANANKVERRAFSFAKDTPLTERVAAVKDYINKLISDFYLGLDPEGVEAFQEHLLEVIEQAGCLEDQVWIDPDKVGVVPDNREGAGLIAADAHDLLRILAKG